MIFESTLDYILIQPQMSRPLNLPENENLSIIHNDNELIETIPIQGHANDENSNGSPFFSLLTNLNVRKPKKCYCFCFNYYSFFSIVK